MTLTRCVLQVDDAVGVGYVRGRSPQHAYRVALADALLQGDQHGSVVENVIVPLQRSERNQREQRTKDVEESRVQFVTLVRGD